MTAETQSKVVELFGLIDADPELVGLEVDEDGFKVMHTTSGLKTLLALNTLEDSDWETIKSVLVGEREPGVLRHMSRVVGYYSNAENWNPSKVGELHDRHKGNYGV